MKKYFKEFSLNQSFIRFSKLSFLAFFFLSSEQTAAQLSRIAIVNLVDSNLIYKHVGLSGFKDKADTFNCRFNCKEYLGKELARILSSKYTVSFLSIPDKLLTPNGSIYNPTDIKKEVNSWVSGLKNKYDFVIFVEAGEQDDFMDPKKQKIKSSGLYSRGNPPDGWVAVYTTTRFSLIRTSNQENLDYDWAAMDYILPVKNYDFPREDVLIDPEMLTLIRKELIKLFDYKLEYFMTNSFLISGDDYEHLKVFKHE